jgi:hypothetical protein
VDFFDHEDHKGARRVEKQAQIIRELRINWTLLASELHESTFFIRKSSVFFKSRIDEGMGYAFSSLVPA